jgi:hypothetical protein
MIAAIKAYDVDSVDDQKEQEHQATWAGEHVRVVSEVERFELPLNTPTLVSRGIILTYIRTDNSVELKPLVEAERVETTTTTEFTLSQLVGFKELKFNTGAGASVGQSFVFVKGLMTGPATSVVVANALGVQQRELPLTEHLTETVSGGPACRFMDCGRTRGGEKLSVVFGAEHYVLRADAARLTAPDFNAQIDLQTVRLEGEIAHVSIGPMGVVAVPDRSLKNPFIGAILLLDTESLRIVEQIQVPQLETFSNLVPYHVCQISATTGFMTFSVSTGNKARSLRWHGALFELVNANLLVFGDVFPYSEVLGSVFDKHRKCLMVWGHASEDQEEDVVHVIGYVIGSDIPVEMKLDKTVRGDKLRGVRNLFFNEDGTRLYATLANSVAVMAGWPL